MTSELMQSSFVNTSPSWTKMSKKSASICVEHMTLYFTFVACGTRTVLALPSLLEAHIWASQSEELARAENLI